MSVVEKGLALAEVVVVGIAKVVWSIVWGTAKFLVSRELWLDPVGASPAGEGERKAEAPDNGSLIARAMMGDPSVAQHNAAIWAAHKPS